MKTTAPGLAQFALECIPGRFPVVRWHGRSRLTRQPARVLVIGRSPHVDHLPGRFFADAPTRESLGTSSLLTLRSTVGRLASSADLVIVRIHRWAVRRFSPTPRLRIPEWIKSRALLPADLATWLAAVGQRRADQKRMRYNRLMTSVSHSSVDFERFYDEMYVPFLRNRHGSQAVVRPRRSLRREFDRGGLIWVHRDGEPLAALLYEEDGRTFRPLDLGTTHGDLHAMKLGALAATYVASMHLAKAGGCSDVDFGGNRPSLQDGVLRYKCKWAAVIGAKPDCFFEQVVWWPDTSPVVLDFLRHVAPIFVEGEGLSGLHVLEDGEAPTAVTARRLHDELWVPGLRRLYLVSPAGWDAVPPPHPTDTVLLSGRQLAAGINP